MYQRSPKAALRVGARCSWRWDGSSSSSPFRLCPGDSARCCHPARLRPRTSEAAPASLTPFQATSGAPSPVTSPTSSNRDMEEHLEVMHQKLREELPGFFTRTHNFAMYSQDVEFINEILHLKTRGLMIYQLAVVLCRFVAWNYFVHMHLEVMKVTQHPENWSIQVRWRIRGLPFHIFLMRFFRNKPEFYRVYDAYSTFFLNPQGLIKCHKVSKLMPSQPLQNKLKNLAVASLLGLELSDQRPSLLPWLVSSSKGHQESIGDS
ncbi:uncharacterized protein C6orf136 homolog isoform X2 [Notechis scutatus]|uniref:Uncharacterized protein C6orf136 homolog isoform X2 n=1 Tax=Notechis scutatus TaxID=8663 RepID=A0A6J1VEU8_9SAUR|nr:uncharacterized protein C6orf136 homolog isoform X2 [Notechis scutatus]